MKKQLVSAIIATKNEKRNIENCIKSILDQTYSPIEILVVDNNSIDKTKEIARRYTKFVFNKGPERSTQRNFGAKKSNGDFLLFLDCDMLLTRNVVEQCVKKINDGFGGLVIPEESFGIGFWARAKALERSFYLGNKSIEAARFFSKKIFEEIGGFDENLIAGEDWDLSQRVDKKSKIARIRSFILHNEGQLSLTDSVRKKYYYAKHIASYFNKKENTIDSSKQSNILGRYAIFLKRPKKLFKDPLLGLGMLFMKTSEFAAGGFGYLRSKKN